MANIQFGGLITGLDTNALINGLVQAERRSINLLQSQKVRFQAQDAVVASVIGALGALKSAAQNLSLSTDFIKRSASSSDNSVLTASADSTAQIGTYNVSVTSLAKANSLQSTSYTSTTETLGTGTLTLSVGGVNTTVTIDATNNNVTALKDAINGSGAAVMASIINTGSSTSPEYRVLVQSNNTGTANAVTISGSLSGRIVTSSDPSVITATADSTAPVGSYDFDVTTLAKAKSIKSAQYLTSDGNTGVGELTISVGGVNTPVTINTTNNTLVGLRDAINASGADVTATIVEEGLVDFRLIVQSNQTGTANAVTISGTLIGGTDPFPNGGTVVQAATDAEFTVNGVAHTRSSNTISDVITGVTFTLHKEGETATLDITTGTDPFPDGGTEVQAATDAQFSVNSLSLTRSSNTVSDAIPGVTLSLLKEGGTATVTVANDTSAAKGNIKKFVESYNAVTKLINDQFTFRQDTKRQGALAGDASLRGVMARLRKELSTAGGIGVGFKYISDLGITFQKDGSLLLNEAKLDSAIAQDAKGVSDLFTVVENGLGKRVPDAVDDYISAVDGALIFRQKGIQKSVDLIDQKIEREERRITAMEERLIKQFTALEELVSQLKSQGDFLSQQLSTLNFSINRNRNR